MQTTQTQTQTTTPEIKQGEGKIDSTMGRALLVVTSASTVLWPNNGKTGFWWSELAHPYQVFEKAGIPVDLCSLNGTTSVDPASVEEKMLDAYTKSQWLDQVSPVHQLLARIQPASAINASNYRTVFYVGGHGAMWDFPSAQPLQDIGAKVYEAGGIIAAVCHGPTILGGLRLSNGQFLVNGKQATGFSRKGESEVGILSKLEEMKMMLTPDLITQAGGHYVEGPSSAMMSHVVSDSRLITGKNPMSAEPVAEAVVALLRQMNRSHGARGLNCVVHDGFVVSSSMMGTADPYIVANFLDAQNKVVYTVRSKTLKNTNEPKFNLTVDAYPPINWNDERSKSVVSLQIDVMDDNVLKDSLIGHARPIMLGRESYSESNSKLFLFGGSKKRIDQDSGNKQCEDSGWINVSLTWNASDRLSSS